jgi:hypothetical protein
MTPGLFEYPKSAALGRVLPKSKIYEHGSPTSAIKELFVRQVDQIVWQFKLAPETINLAPSRSVPEIEVFSMILKESEIKWDVLRFMDQSIPFPIFFEVCYEDQIKAIAAYKRPSEVDSTKWVVSDYFATSWLPKETPRTPLPIILNLESLYASLLTSLMPFSIRSGEGLQDFVARMELFRSRQKELEKCEFRLRKEKQFNRKVKINSELRELKREIETLTSSIPNLST